MGNRCLTTDWLPHIYSEAPLSYQNYFRLLSVNVKVNVTELKSETQILYGNRERICTKLAGLSVCVYC
jgi:hypothetical protein